MSFLLLALVLLRPVQQASPKITAVVNAASYVGGPVAPYTIVTVFGSNLGDGTTASAATVPLPEFLASVFYATGFFTRRLRR
jgi:hypothetical protein